jgi:hypothetical protein
MTGRILLLITLFLLQAADLKGVPDDDDVGEILELIRENLLVNREMADLRGGPIIPELCLFCTVRWLAGGSYLDIIDITGISVASFYRIVWKT